MVEVVIALMVLTVGILAIISLQPSAWRLAGKSDYVGRAAGILQRQLQLTEAQILNPANAIPADSTITVYASGQGAPQPGDAAFTVQTTTLAAADIGPDAFRVAVRVTWAGAPIGIAETIMVVRQEGFRE